MVESHCTLVRRSRRSADVSAAIQGEDARSWRKAIDTEINAITEDKTLSLVPRNEGDNILTSKWVFKRLLMMTEGKNENIEHALSCEDFNKKRRLTTMKRMPR